MRKSQAKSVSRGGVALGLLLAGSITGEVAGAPVANAQEVSDLQPPTPAPTQGQIGAASTYWIPGMPPPVLGGASANGMNASGGLKADAPHAAPRHGEAVLDASDMQGPIGVDDPHADDAANMPEVHRVQKGDTLWDISNTYFRTPWYWPKLWALNPSITNPHWIYPGDLVRLRVAGEVTPAAGSLPTAESEPDLQRIQSAHVDTAVTLRQTGFVEQGELKAAGRIIGSREEKELLSNLDEVYVEFDKNQPLRPGERYSVYHVVRDVKEPGSRDVIGHIVAIDGDLEVRSVGENRVAKAVIVDAMDPIERKFRVGPLRRRYALGEPTASRKDLDAEVVATLRPVELLGESMVVFINRGKDDGVLPGNRFMVVRRGDGVQPLLQLTAQDDKRFPREVYGEAQVVEVRNKTSTAIVLRSTRELVIGDHVQARKGY